MAFKFAGAKLTFAERATNVSVAGQSGLLPVRRVLAQQLLAFAAQNPLRCSAVPKTSHSIAQTLVETKLPFRCTLFELERRGLSRHCKDLRLSQDAALSVNATTPLSAHALAIFSHFCDSGHSEMDYSGISKLIGGDAWDYGVDHSILS